MRRLVIPPILFGLVLLIAAARSEAAKGDQNVRSLTGQVIDNGDAALEKAVVYLKNKRSLQVRTFITGADGSYHFNGLDPNVDYEVRAQYQGASSPTRTLSAFDNRKDVSLNLRVDTKKAEGGRQ